MCTLIVSFRGSGEWPLVVAANRDERLDRPASPPRLWPGPVPFVAPRDDLAGGTWLGLNARGLFVGVTNRFGAGKEEGRESRGALVVEALGHESAAALHQKLASLKAGRFNAFHLLYADREAAFVTWSDGSRVRQEELRPGLHVVTERSLGGDDRSRGELVKERWRRLEGTPPSTEALEALLSIHRDEVLGGTCMHAPSFGYGTRSSAVLLLGRELAKSRLRWAEGPPCTAPFVELPQLLQALAFGSPASAAPAAAGDRATGACERALTCPVSPAREVLTRWLASKGLLRTGSGEPPPAGRAARAGSCSVPELQGELLKLCHEGLLDGGLSASLDVRPDELIGPLARELGGTARKLKVLDVRGDFPVELTVQLGESAERWELQGLQALAHNLNDLYRNDRAVKVVAVLGEWEDMLQLWCVPKQRLSSLLRERFFLPTNRAQLERLAP